MQNPSNQPLSLPTAFKYVFCHMSVCQLHKSSLLNVLACQLHKSSLLNVLTYLKKCYKKSKCQENQIAIRFPELPLPLESQILASIFTQLLRGRVIQVLSAGLFLPGSAGFIDPCEPNNRRVHSSIPLLQKDEICCAAQTICRIIGQNKYSVLFDVQRGNSPLSPETLTSLANKLPGLEVLLSEPVYVEPPSTSVEDSSRLETDEDGISEIEAMENHEAAV
ncbi:unnamed protein product [Dibothriocephalus latus]|uniref:DZF domain-containing protein n=1 Tax=Dibothriocephalus latus TaxID=60516 RepID=A0A3P7NGQ7_DIBLA|nr:unnamed protein product [Dibothriocephalus latus]